MSQEDDYLVLRKLNEEIQKELAKQNQQAGSVASIPTSSYPTPMIDEPSGRVGIVGDNELAEHIQKEFLRSKGVFSPGIVRKPDPLPILSHKPLSVRPAGHIFRAQIIRRRRF